MKKVVLMVSLVFLFFSCTNEETTLQEEKGTRADVAAKEEGIDYEINDCQYDIRGDVLQAYETTVTGPGFYGGPMTSAVNVPDCQNSYPPPNTASVQPIINIHFEVANYRPDRCVTHEAYFEISQTAVSPVLPYGNINKIYPLTNLASMDLKFNMNYILRCDDPLSDPTGPNVPYPVYTPYPIPYNSRYTAFDYPPPASDWYNYIFGSKHFYYRIVIRSHNECTGVECVTVTNWKRFEWIL